MDEKSRKTLEFDKVLKRLAALTSFSAGQSLALRVEPTTYIEDARRWQAETREALALFDVRTDITIGGARDVRRPADNAQRGYVLPPEDILDVRATIAAGRDLRRKLDRLEDQCPNLFAIGQLLEECPGIISAISSALDERGEVLDSASSELAQIRRQLRIVHDRIYDKLQSLLGSSNNQYLQEATITTRAGRYVVPLMANHKGRIRGIVHDQSNSGATLWIEPLNTVELNNEFRSLQIAEQDEIQRILSELSGRIAEQGDAIKRVVERLAELDLIFARARLAAETKAIEPEFVPWRESVSIKPPKHANEADKWQPPASRHPGCTFWISGARHPLLDPGSVVPTDLTLDEKTYVVLITGPNTGGKTVSLKTAGLMILMAQSGLHLPALEARLTVFRDVFADIGDEQSIEQNLSTFSAHLTNIIHIIDQVDDRSLVLLDELGSGTDPAEGAALAQSIVSYLYDMGATTFVATHFPELKLYASQTPGATNASLLFDVDTLMPTFEMSIGVPGRSNAFAIARRLGLDATILDEGLRLIGANSTKTDSLLDTIYQMREKIASQEAGTRLALRQAEEERDKLREKLERIEVERREILERATQEGQEELEAVRREIRQVRRKLRDAESLNKLKKLQKQTEQIEQEIENRDHTEDAIIIPQEKKKPRRKGDFLIGDTVMVIPLKTKGKIIELEKHEAVVAVGRLHMRAQLDELEFREREEEEEPLEGSGRAPSASPGMELDLRGKRVDEGLQVLEQYLDAAFLANLPWVRIIHGKGTGRLRQAVREALQTNGHVTSYEEGRDGEGGAGVTIAKFEQET
ncbi:MAG: Smr/MutS family protein [Chloroflexota bacterium]|jgi:DNA mismatch repair protein MutS2